MATTSADFGAAGLNQAITGQTQITNGERVLQSLGLSPQVAAITYGLIGLSPAAVEVVAVNKAINEAAAYNILVKDSYASGASTTANVIKGAVPNAENAIIDSQKVIGYALNPNHPVGGNKAVVFDSALGYNQSNAGGLMEQVKNGVTQNSATLGKADQFGQRYTIDMPIKGPNGNTAIVRTGWIVDTGSTTPRLTTIYVK